MLGTIGTDKISAALDVLDTGKELVSLLASLDSKVVKKHVDALRSAQAEHDEAAKQLNASIEEYKAQRDQAALAQKELEASRETAKQVIAKANERDANSIARQREVRDANEALSEREKVLDRRESNLDAREQEFALRKAEFERTVLEVEKQRADLNARIERMRALAQ